MNISNVSVRDLKFYGSRDSSYGMSFFFDFTRIEHWFQAAKFPWNDFEQLNPGENIGILSSLKFAECAHSGRKSSIGALESMSRHSQPDAENWPCPVDTDLVKR